MARARLVETVDLPTPPLPDATAMMSFTPGSFILPPPQSHQLNRNLFFYVNRLKGGRVYLLGSGRPWPCGPPCSTGRDSCIAAYPRFCQPATRVLAAPTTLLLIIFLLCEYAILFYCVTF